jgi:tRNA-Thr(GGU) m(6)t(6)A37 methyltransferase TsaA
MTDTPAAFSFDAIGIVRSPFKEKFGIPRQPGLTSTLSVIELLPPYAVADAVKGLDAFSHIWITFVFHAVQQRDWKPLVRPPRLGGNEKLGVFATRSTHRPNPIGLSVVALEKIETDGGVRLHVRGADLLDGTPVLDIKPYLPYADSIADARAGFAPTTPPRMAVRWQAEALQQAAAISNELRAMIEDILAFDPRPAYQNEPERIYGVHIGACNVRFRIDAGGAEIISVQAVAVD